MVCQEPKVKSTSIYLSILNTWHSERGRHVFQSNRLKGMFWGSVFGRKKGLRILRIEMGQRDRCKPLFSPGPTWCSMPLSVSLLRIYEHRRCRFFLLLFMLCVQLLLIYDTLIYFFINPSIFKVCFNIYYDAVVFLSLQYILYNVKLFFVLNEKNFRWKNSKSLSVSYSAVNNPHEDMVAHWQRLRLLTQWSLVRITGISHSGKLWL